MLYYFSLFLTVVLLPAAFLDLCLIRSLPPDMKEQSDSDQEAAVKTLKEKRQDGHF